MLYICDNTLTPLYSPSHHKISRLILRAGERIFVMISMGSVCNEVGSEAVSSDVVVEVEVNSNELLIDLEMQIEAKAMDVTRERYERQLERMTSQGDGSQTGVGKLFIKKTVAAFAQGIDEFLNPDKGQAGWNTGRQKHVRGLFDTLDLKPVEYAYITMTVILDHWLKDDRTVFQSYALDIANNCLREYEYRRLKAEYPEYLAEVTKDIQKKTESKKHLWKVLRDMKKKTLGLYDMEVSELERLSLGSKLLEIMIESTGAFELDRHVKGKADTPLILKPAEESLRILRQSSDWFAFAHPVYPIMVAPPLDWTDLHTGGYYSPGKYLQPDLVKLPRKVLNRLEGHEMPDVYKAINSVQSVAWRINTKVLDVLKELWETTPGGVAGLPEKYAVPLPPKPWGEINSPEEWKQYKEQHLELVRTWMKAAEAAYQAEIRSVSRRLAIGSYIIPMAEEVRNHEAIYFPWTLDFRGRMYPLVPYVNPQADDCGKSLLMFAEGKRLGSDGVWWLAIHGANTAGFDKASFEDRVGWVVEHEEMILSCAERPLEDLRWADTDSPMQFLAFCFEWAQYKITGEDTISHLPVAMDGTCNGLQHLSAMLLDERGGSAVNLLPAEKPADIYTEVRKEVEASIERDIAGTDEEKQAKARFWQGKITRSLVKRPTMTTPYGVSHRGVHEQLLGEAESLGLLVGCAVPPRVMVEYLTEIVIQAISHVVRKAREAMDWLMEAAKVACKLELPLEWTTPIGFKVVQHYSKLAGNRINLFIGKTRIRLTSGEVTTELDTRHQVSGIAPNFVHSLDASMLMGTVNKLVEIGEKSFAFIHDSYGVHASEVDKLHQILRDQFIRIYTNRIISSAKNKWEQAWNAELPDEPTMGSLDINQVRYSSYFFA